MSGSSIPVLATIFCAVAMWPSSAQERPQSPSVDAVVTRLAGGLVERSECLGVAVGVDHGGVQRFYGFGEVERGTGRRPGPSTEFEIGSITKVFTTTLLALYAQRHVVKLDAPLQDYVPRGVTVPNRATDSADQAPTAAARDGGSSARGFSSAIGPTRDNGDADRSHAGWAVDERMEAPT
jgi:CubicO group peptidase (beta-lactamase class C family)